MASAEILTVGDELLSPGKSDSNSQFLTERLGAMGIPIRFRGTVGDHRERLKQAVLSALSRSDIVLLTGGLGPTSDDLTRDAVAEALGVSLELHEPTLKKIRERFSARNRPMPEVNKRQAMRPTGSEVLDNPAGTAPGLWIRPSRTEWASKVLVLLPGPPRELHPLFIEHVEPRLRKLATDSVTLTRSLNVIGLFESMIEERIGDLYRDRDNPNLSILVSRAQVEIRIVAEGATSSDAKRLVDEMASSVYERLGDHIFSEGSVELEEVVARHLVETGLSVSVAESITGGLIMHRLTQVPGSSRFFQHGWVSYSNESKVDLLGVSEETLERVGAVSEEVAREMARGARKASGADLALSVTGIAGPGGATETKPVGLVYVGLSSSDGEEVVKLLLTGDRALNKRLSSQSALDLLRRRLMQIAR